ncbi:protein-export chaperone SecB [Eshraghiella crossota]|uniref:protein-export chaperone SecB n=1 Tax=Eshraghiella crossota TaxID=45851 RepID=UPI003F7D19BA
MESAFQFSNPSLTKMEFCINEEFESSQDKEVKIAVNMGVQIDRSATDNNARVSLTLEIGKKDSEDPFYVCATEMAEFRWSEALNNEMVEKMLNQNAPSLLLGYLRPIISQITAASPYNAYNLPFIDFSRK